jgi:hypothetical protein
MKTTKKHTQCQRLLAYLKRHKKGITTMEAFQHLGITCVHKRIRELETTPIGMHQLFDVPVHHRIIRTPERTASGARIIRYKLAR